MKPLRYVSLLLLLLSAVVAAQSGQRAKRVQRNEEMVVKQRIQDEWKAWYAMDVKRAGTFYAKDADLVFFDIAPHKFTGWSEYEKGVTQLLAPYRSLGGSLNDDLAVKVHGNLAWSTGTVKMVGVRKDGKPDDVLNLRMTGIWERRQGTWLLVHEHVSVALPSAT